MKYLQFYFRGQTYKVNETGCINANGINKFSDSWIFLGGSKHHWTNYPHVSLKDCFINPDLLNGCLGWDKDHGTIRQWSGTYNGKMPRITGTTIKEA